jgi:hypothetical protein
MASASTRAANTAPATGGGTAGTTTAAAAASLRRTAPTAMIHLRAHLDSIPLAVARTEVQITLAVPAKPGSFSRALVCPPVCVCGCVWVSMGESLCVSVCFFLPCSPFRFLGSGFECIFFFSVSTNNRFVSFTHTLSLSLFIYMTQNCKVFASGARNGWIS